MIVFITTVLILAAAQSFCKLALLPRRWEFLAATALAPLPLLFEKRIAGLSLKALNDGLTASATLENWCAVVVIQELFTLVVGFSLLADCSGRPTVGVLPRSKRWKMLAMLPSLLLPAGVFYLEIRLFNAFPAFDFRTLSWIMTAALPFAVVLPTEAVRLCRRAMESRILTALHAEYLLLVPAIFLPVAARARLMPETVSAEAPVLPVLGALAACVGLSALGFEVARIIRNHTRKRKNGFRHANSQLDLQ